MHVIVYNQKTRCLTIPSGSSININTKSFDKIVQDRKEQSVKVAMAELTMEGEENRPAKKRRISDADATFIRSPFVQVMVDDTEINMLWATNSSVIWIEMTEPWFFLIGLHSIRNISGLAWGFCTEKWFNFKFV